MSAERRINDVGIRKTLKMPSRGLFGQPPARRTFQHSLAMFKARVISETLRCTIDDLPRTVRIVDILSSHGS
jgi:hypothetical protein